jgi:polar amino acid transport system permease protein
MQQFFSSFFDVEVAKKYALVMVPGLAFTFSLALAIIVSGTAMGIGLASLRTYGYRWTNFGIAIAVDILRAVPPLAIIVVIYFALPFLGITLPGTIAAWLSLSTILAAFVEEIVFGAIATIPRGQWDASRSLGLSFGRSLRAVILPQALRLAIGPLTNRAIAIGKNTSLASVIAVPELLNRATSAMSASGNTTPLTIAAIFYLMMFLPLVLLSRSMERRFPATRVDHVQ